MDINLKDREYQIKDQLREIRRTLYMNPELSFEEYETGKLIEGILTDLGIKVIKNVGKTGIVGILEGKQSGKVVALRGDIDALPVTEEIDINF